jgi:putative thioredoxin
LYERALLENPSDFLAEAGLAQVKLLIRLQGQDLEALAASGDSSYEAILLKADALIASGGAAAGFELLLSLFEETAKDSREPIRLRLVEMFLVVGNDSPEVIAARKSLSLLLF